MLRHAALLALKLGSAVKHGQAVLVLGEVGRDPVHNHADARSVQAVNHVLEVVRVAVAGGGGVVTGDLIAPGGRIGVLGQRHKFHMGIAHVLAISDQLLSDLPVDRLLAGQVLPGADMQLIHAHGLLHELALRALFHIVLVGPAAAAAGKYPGGRLLIGLAPGGKGVGLQHLAAVGSVDAVFIQCAVLQALHKADPHAAFHRLHGGGVPVPVVEVAHQGDPAGVGGPDHKAVHFDPCDIVAAKGKPCLLCSAGIKKIDIVPRDILLQFLVHGVNSPFHSCRKQAVVSCWISA